MKNTKEFIVEQPVRIKLFETSIKLLSILSKKTQKIVKEKIVESAAYLNENYHDLPEKEIFEYSTDLDDGTVFSFVGFWDRNENEECIVIASFGFCGSNHETSPAEMEFAKNLMTYYFVCKKFANNN